MERNLLRLLPSITSLVLFLPLGVALMLTNVLAGVTMLDCAIATSTVFGDGHNGVHSRFLSSFRDDVMYVASISRSVC